MGMWGRVNELHLRALQDRCRWASNSPPEGLYQWPKEHTELDAKGRRVPLMTTWFKPWLGQNTIAPFITVPWSSYRHGLYRLERDGKGHNSKWFDLVKNPDKAELLLETVCW